MPAILFTGGGTAGHVTPSLPLIGHFRELGWDVHYAGSLEGIERDLIMPTGVPYHALATGKLRRYFSWENLLDVGRVARGVWQGWRLCRRLRPDVVFSKGGFVSVPVVVGAWLARIPVVAHESDLTPGLATRLVAPLAHTVCTSFPDTRVARARRQQHVGTPLRGGLLEGERQRGLDHAGLAGERPVLLVVGGSLGSQALNVLVREALPQLLLQFEIIHVCGRGNLAPELDGRCGYAQFEFVTEPYADLLAAADMVLSRAGANGLFELLLARKPALLVPLGLGASRGDQVENAGWAEARGLALQIDERGLDRERLQEALQALWSQRHALDERLQGLQVPDSKALLVDLLESVAGRRPAREG